MNNEGMKEYYFHYTQGFKPNYILETPNKEVLYEAKNLKLALFSNYKFNFVNH